MAAWIPTALRVAGWTAALCAALVVLSVALLLLVDWNLLRGQVEGLASEFLGREVRIGHLAMDIGRDIDIRVRNLTIGNPHWADREHLLQLAEGQVGLRTLPLLWGELRIQRIRLQQPDLSVQRTADGRINTRFPALAKGAARVAAPEQGSEFPIVRRILVADGRLHYRDAGRDLDLQGTVASGTAQARASDPLRLSLTGSLQGRPLTVDLDAGSVLRLRDTDTPYPLSLEVRHGDTHISARGTTLDLVHLQALRLDLQLRGPTLADLFPLLNLPLPDTPPYDLAGDLGYRDGVWVLHGFSGTIGDSDARGQASLDTNPAPPMFIARVLSRHLDLDDLAGLIGASPDPTETANPSQVEAARRPGLLPHIRFRADRYHAMNMDVRFEGERVITPLLPIDRLSFRARVQDGRVEARPLSLAIAGGSIVGEAALNARDTPPSADVDVDFEHLDLQPFFRDTPFVQQMGGRFSGHLYLLGVGHTLAALLANARGKASIAMRDGSVSALLVEAAGLDVTEALGLLLGDDVRVPIRCGRVDLDVDRGVGDISRLLLDTTDSLLVGKGTVDFGQEHFELQIEARAKDFSLIDINAPVRVWGTYPQLEYAIGGIDPLPFLEMGEQPDIDCDRLVAGVARRRQAPTQE